LLAADRKSKPAVGQSAVAMSVDVSAITLGGYRFFVVLENTGLSAARNPCCYDDRE